MRFQKQHDNLIPHPPFEKEDYHPVNKRMKRQPLSPMPIPQSQISPPLLPAAEINKLALLQELNQILNTHKSTHCRDETISRRLVEISEMCGKLKYREVRRLAALAFGKITIDKERQRREELRGKKLERKREINNQDRHNKILNCDYDLIQQQKNSERTFVFSPYPNGRGFNLNTPSLKGVHRQTLKYVRAEEVLHAINSVYFQNAAYFKFGQDVCRQRVERSIRLLLVLLVGVLVVSQTFMERTVGTDVTCLVTLCMLGVYAVCVTVRILVKDCEGHDNLTEQGRVIRKIQGVLDDHNRKVEGDVDIPIKYTWKCPDHFLWIEVTLHGDYLKDYGWEPGDVPLKP